MTILTKEQYLNIMTEQLKNILRASELYQIGVFETGSDMLIKSLGFNFCTINFFAIHEDTLELIEAFLIDKTINYYINEIRMQFGIDLEQMVREFYNTIDNILTTQSKK